MRALKTELDQEYEVQNGLKQSASQDADARKLSSAQTQTYDSPDLTPEV